MKKIIVGSILFLTLGACSTGMIPERFVSSSSQERPDWVEPDPGLIRGEVVTSKDDFYEGHTKGPDHLDDLEFNACHQAVMAWKKYGKRPLPGLILSGGSPGAGAEVREYPGAGEVLSPDGEGGRKISTTYWEKWSVGEPGKAFTRFDVYCLVDPKGDHS